MQAAVSFLKDSLCDRFTGFGVNDDKVKTLSEACLAQAFAKAFSSGYFRQSKGAIYMYDGRKYVQLNLEDDKELGKIIVSIFQALDVGIVYHLKSTVNNICSRIYNEYLPEFKPSKSMISFRNGVLDLNSEVFHEHDERFMTRTYLDFDYDAKADCPGWRVFISEVLDDESQRDILQEFLGCIFIDRSQLSIETALFLFGTGANGKGVVSDTLKYMLGESCSNAELAQICTGKDSDYHRASIDGKLLNFSVDMGTDEFSSGAYKAIVSHEPIQVRPIGRKPYTAYDMPLVASSINNIPVITDNSDGFWRRFCILIFRRTFEGDNMDKTLKFRMQSEVSGIFNWIMEGRRRLVENKGKFTFSEISELEKQKAKNASDSVLNFLSDHYYYPKVKDYMKSPREIRISSKDLYNKYKNYCLEVGFKAKGVKSFKESLVRSKYEYKNSVKIDGTVTNGYRFYECPPSYDEIEEFDLPELSSDQIEAIKEEEKMNELPF